MSGGQAPGAAPVADGAAPRRRKPARPPTVPLAEFGKAPPPPPRVRLTPRQIAIYTVSGIALSLMLWFAAVQFERLDRWSNAGNIDQRNR